MRAISDAVNRLLCLLFAVSWSCLLQAAELAGQPSLRIPRVSQPPRLEDFPNGDIRGAQARVTGFKQFQPGDGASVSQETSAYISYDQKNLYVVFVCKDEPGKVRARMAKREDIFTDDLVAVDLDTFRDHQRVYIFATNPLGIQLDGILTEGQPSPDWSFDTLWHSEGRLTDDGFIVRMAIPFKSLRFPNAPVQTWGIALARSIPRNNELSFWPYITNRVQGIVQQLATLEGLEDVSPGRNVQFIPYGVFARAQFLDRLMPAFRAETDARGGLDAKIVVRDALTIDVALNPDFSQVESDEPQVTINQRFEVFFPEKRPFFIENAGFFKTRENLFFSRRIADPQFGLRLTGKMDRWALAGLVIDDRAPGRRVPANDPLRDRRAGIGVMRIQREFAKQSSVGLLLTSHDFESDSNRVLSVDTRLKLHENWTLSGQVMYSHSDLGGERLSGPAYSAEIEHSGRHFIYLSRYTDRSPAFRSLLGFIPRVDIRQVENLASYRWRPKGRSLLSLGPSISTVLNWDHQGRMQDWVIRSGFGVELKRLTILEISRSEAFELFQNQGFRKNSTAVVFSSEWFKWMAVSTSYALGTGINFFPAPGLPPFLANSMDARFRLTLRPKPHIRFDQSYIYSRLATHRDALPSGSHDSAAIFNNHIFRSKLNYQFNRPLSLRVILEYNAVLPNPSLVALKRSKRLTADFLLTYLINPGTALHVGYTDQYENLDLAPVSPPAIDRIGLPTTSTGRQLFFKVSYLFRF